MMRLHPAVRKGLIFAGVHQIILLCGALSVFVSEDLLTTFGIGVGMVDLPVVLATISLRDAGWIQWKAWGMEILPTVPLSALVHYARVMLPFFVAGALQWFLIGYFVGWRQALREAPQ